MNCHDTKRLMALHLGHDEGDVSEWEPARRHASTCVDCRQYYKQLKKSMAALEQSDVESTYDVPQSLWPEIEIRLTQQPRVRHENLARSWAPVVSFTVACVLFLMVWTNPPGNQTSRNEVPHAMRGMGPFPTSISPTDRRHNSHPEIVREKDRRKEDQAL